MIARLLAGIFVVVCTASAFAQGNQQPPPKPPAEDEKAPTFEEQVVVSASRSEQALVNAPAAVTLITAQKLANSPGTNMGDLLRAVPGINVTQTSARDVNVTTRGATSTLATSQLALVDGRSIYLDFFGMVMWDLVPTNPHEIKRIEVIRGPASAVWGANAMTGVVNVITKTPRELAADGGNSVTIGAGAFNRNVTGLDQDTGSLFYVNGSHAQAVDDRWSYKLSAGYFTQDPLPRPFGTIPNAFNTPYPPFANTGTSQPKFDARVDYDLAGGNGGRLVFAGGVAGTEGIIHSGIGPFDIDSESQMTYFTTRYEKGGRRIAFFTNLLDGRRREPAGRGDRPAQPLPLVFDTKTFDVEASDVRAIGTRHALSFGGELPAQHVSTSRWRRTETTATRAAPTSRTRSSSAITSAGSSAAASTSSRRSTTRCSRRGRRSWSSRMRRRRSAFSFNRAFRAPSFINNNIDTTILNQVNLCLLARSCRFVFPIRAIGNPDLKQETMTAYEVGYTGGGRETST